VKQVPRGVLSVGNKKSRKRRAESESPGVRLERELGLDSTVWSVSVGYRKGFLSGDRYASVSVCHLPTGRERRESFYATGKAAARRDAAAVARRLIKELQGG
jgi:hypothetical protein